MFCTTAVYLIVPYVAVLLQPSVQECEGISVFSQKYTVFSNYRISLCLSFTHTDTSSAQAGNSDRSCDNETGLMCLMSCTPQSLSPRCFFHSLLSPSACMCISVCLSLAPFHTLTLSPSLMSAGCVCPCGALDWDAWIRCKDIRLHQQASCPGILRFTGQSRIRDAVRATGMILFILNASRTSGWYGDCYK